MVVETAQRSAQVKFTIWKRVRPILSALRTASNARPA